MFVKLNKLLYIHVLVNSITNNFFIMYTYILLCYRSRSRDRGRDRKRDDSREKLTEEEREKERERRKRGLPPIVRDKLSGNYTLSISTYICLLIKSNIFL